MSGKKIATLNQAIREALPEGPKAPLADHPEVSVMMRAIKFSDTASWHVGPQPVALERFVWPELSTAGATSTARAIRLLAPELALEKMPRQGCPPVCILVSDGICTDPEGEYDAAIADLLKLPWGRKAVRLAIGVGDESDYDEGELLKFVSHNEIGVLARQTHPENSSTSYIVWASVAASVGSTVGKSRMGAAGPNDPNVALPTPDPLPATDLNALDVF